MRLGANYFTEDYIPVSNYPAWWNTTITVFNKYEDPGSRKITWYKTVIHNCFWKNTGNKIVVGETTLDTNATMCRIPRQDNFVEKYEWNSLQDKSNHFTLGMGDLIIKGEVEEVIDEYQSGLRSSDILAKHKKLQDCMTIEQCAVNTGLGRGLEHYYVRGL
jgi:hypothetical protein